MPGGAGDFFPPFSLCVIMELGTAWSGAGELVDRDARGGVGRS